MKSIYHFSWEQELDYQFASSDNQCRKKAYVCSPLHAQCDDDLVDNMRTARAYMYYAMKKMNLSARAPHAYLPMLLCDRVPAERALGIQFGIKLLEHSDLLLICGDRISCGMRGEIEQAVKLGISMLAFDETVYWEACKIVTQCGGKKRSVRLDREHMTMASAFPVSYMMNAGRSQ